MSRRQRAIDILKQYQDALAERLTEIVIDQEEQLMDDATGPDLGFTNDLYELAEKLRAVSVTLSVMPPEKPAEQPGASFQDNNSVVVITALPQITISDFISLVDANDLERAAAALSHVFDIPIHRAARCTDHFVRKLETDNETMNKVYLLAQKLHQSMSQSLILMGDLFGLLPAEAQQVVYRLSRK